MKIKLIVFGCLVTCFSACQSSTKNESSETEASSPNLTMDEVKARTLELLESSEIDDVSYITEEMIESDLKLTTENEDIIDDKSSGTMYGHNMRYSNRQIDGRTYQVYVYERGPNKYSSSDGCKNDYTKWLKMDNYNHYKDGDCSSRDARIRFVSR